MNALTFALYVKMVPNISSMSIFFFFFFFEKIKYVKLVPNILILYQNNFSRYVLGGKGQ